VRIFGYELSLTKKTTSPVPSTGWWPIIREPYTGAWQSNQELRGESLMAYFAIYSCVSLICADVGKLRPTIQRKDSDGIWQEAEGLSAASLLRKPNRYQNHIQFKEWWIASKLKAGNAYVLKERDRNGTVRALYVLDPTRVQVLIADDGSVYYQLSQDELNTLTGQVTVPASEIIHDRMACLFHPLVGVPPLYANALAASQGQKIQFDSFKFFGNGAKPSGILTAPGAISDETAGRLKAYWDANYTGDNAGKIAVVGDGLKFDPLKMTALDAQLVEQLRLTVDVICATFHVPAFKIGFGTMPAGQKIEDLNQIYYSDCLQSLIESMELCLDEGLALPDGQAFELDLSGLLRMDTATQFKVLGEGVGASILTPNEARKRVNLRSLEGGDTVYMQQQNYSLAALAERDAQSPLVAQPAPVPAPEPEDDDDEPEETDMEKALPIKLPAARFA